MQLPHFPESDHSLIKPLFPLSDRELMGLFKRHADSGRYFVAIFCRYSPIVYSLVRHSAKSPVQAEYLFAIIWRHIFHELGGIEPTEPPPDTDGTTAKAFSLQSWLINITALCINQAVVPEAEQIHYSLQDATPPFWCYVEQALDQLPPTERFIVLMTHVFRWSQNRTLAYLQAEGEKLSTAELEASLRRGLQQLNASIPADIRQIYLGEWNALAEMDVDQADDDLEILTDLDVGDVDELLRSPEEDADQPSDQSSQTAAQTAARN